MPTAVAQRRQYYGKESFPEYPKEFPPGKVIGKLGQSWAFRKDRFQVSLYPRTIPIQKEADQAHTWPLYTRIKSKY